MEITFKYPLASGNKHFFSISWRSKSSFPLPKREIYLFSFEKIPECFKSRFDSRFRIYAKIHADWHRNHWFWCILRRVTAILLEKKNFGPNVRACLQTFFRRCLFLFTFVYFCLLLFTGEHGLQCGRVFWIKQKARRQIKALSICRREIHQNRIPQRGAAAFRPPLLFWWTFSPTDALFWWISLRQMLKPLIFLLNPLNHFSLN